MPVVSRLAREYPGSTVPRINWDTETYEPAPWGGGVGQLCVEVEGVDAGWAKRFNEITERHYSRGDTRGARWGLVRYHQVEGIITIDELSDGQHDALRERLEELCEMAVRSTS